MVLKLLSKPFFFYSFSWDMSVSLNLIISVTLKGVAAHQLNKTPFASSGERCVVWVNSAGMQPGVYMGVRRSESGGPHGTCNVAPAAGTRCERTRQGTRMTAGN